ncbi:Exopolysaccharide production negative regulator [Quillaja saponaria]|uniref:Exopolysaccharide production negative regulator n=1 Tax=Quillaja saponaria TaxID=32244 RepID=A0AAD7P6H0_QUISA|nr:Exopolysaccharide production negative regulator [Quillaja saponaria]
MDSSQEVLERTEKTGLPLLVLRLVLMLLFPIIFYFSLPFLIGFLVVLVSNLPTTNLISLSSQCKILSTSVDIRSSKVCELGLLNYKANHVFYPFERSKFRCRYDYYWASVFKVEYRDHFSGQTRFAFAEAPNEALPLYCRPNFGAAWLTQYKFKVNETYDCWYTSGISKISLYQNDLFSCQANGPSAIEMIRRYSNLSAEIMHSWFSSRGRARYWKWETIFGVVTGFSTSLISISFFKLLQQLLSSLRQICVTRILPIAFNPVRVRRACLLVAYCSFVAWLAIQYVKRLHLMEIFLDLSGRFKYKIGPYL